ncbi:MAG TPA: pyruvate dehydrogenase complex dihydrolipoamide acetyltransferase [Bacteroidia bacterium]|nr:pyruvate dehydrogenase complex dihydrolipoamide acetyltransferase [Bacteroidia bacterium]
MAEIIKMPKLSDTMTEGVVAKWHKKVGDKVKNGEIIADIETDKATMEFESFYDGTLLYIGAEAGKPVAIDALIAVIGKDGEDISKIISGAGTPAPAAADTKKAEPAATNGAVKESAKPAAEVKKVEIPATINIVRMPKLSDTMTQGVVAKWHKKVGDKVKNGELLADIETDKATMEFESFFDGVLLYQGTEAGKAVEINSLLAIIGKGDEDIKAIVAQEKELGAVAAPAAQPAKQEVAATATTVAQPVATATTVVKHASGNGRIIASPLAKKIAKDKGIDIAVVHGSGDGGRIIKKDIETYTPFGGAASTFVGTESYTEVPVSQMRKTIARRLVESKNGAPHFYLTVECDMENAISAREAINKAAEKNGEAKISYNDIVIKACASALRKHPKVNSSWLGDKIRYNNHIHIGMAVAVEDGLLVPVIRFTDGKSLSQISAEAKEFGKKAKEKKLQPADWEGNTFTVSNLGMFGIDEFTSIINSPESCILAVGGIRQVPVVKNNMVVPGNTMKITLSCDHRTVDGATGAAFMQTLKGFLENPIMMFV